MVSEYILIRLLDLSDHFYIVSRKSWKHIYIYNFIHTQVMSGYTNFILQTDFLNSKNYYLKFWIESDIIFYENLSQI